MESKDLNTWKDAVNLHIDQLNSIIDDRKTLKNSIEEHLKTVFDWDDIDYNRDFSVITLKWAKGVNPVIRPDVIEKLGMDWIIKAEYDDNAFRIVIIEIYPWGVKEGLQDSP